LPPRFKISTPACDPSPSSVTTMACAARTACLGQVLFVSDWTAGLDEVCAATRGARTAVQVRIVKQSSKFLFLREIMTKRH